MKRTWFMQHLMMIAAPKVALIALENRTIEGSMEAALHKAIEEEMGGVFAPDIRSLLTQFGGDVKRAVSAIINSIPSSQPYQVQVVDLKPFVLTKDFRLGIATPVVFASIAWLQSDEDFAKVTGRKFSWIAPDGKEYVDDKAFFRRPTETQVERLLSPEIIKKAIEKGFIRIKTDTQ